METDPNAEGLLSAFGRSARPLTRHCVESHRGSYPNDATLGAHVAAATGGGIHTPDLTAIGVDPHALRFHMAGMACRMPGLWQLEWWCPAGSS
jgi:hypothetical protein